jgi:cation diffusion facilitator family transporter
LAAFTIAVLTFVLAFEVFRESLARIFLGSQPEMSLVPIFVLGGVILTKLGMFLVARRFPQSPALIAVAADAKMDIVISSLAIGGVVAINLGWPQLDSYLALVIAVWIAWIGFTILRENLARLMGHSPDSKTLDKIRAKLEEFQKQKKIKSFQNLKVQFIGSEIQIAVEVKASKNLSLGKVHDLEESIQKRLRSCQDFKVCSVAVHIEPF